MPDHTDGPFDVELQSDDGGNHITIIIEHHADAQKILSVFCDRFKDKRIIVLNVPEGFLDKD
jgi:hypothetical protein